MGFSCRREPRVGCFSLAGGVSLSHLHLPSVKDLSHRNEERLFHSRIANLGWGGFRPICAVPGEQGRGGNLNNKMKPSPGVTWTRTFKSFPHWEHPCANDKNSGTVFRKPIYPLKRDVCRNPHFSVAQVAGSLSKGHPF